MLSQARFVTKRDRSTDSSVNEFVLAYKKLAHLLHHGFVGQGLHRVPVAGDTTKLPYVKGLTRLERKLAWAQNFTAKAHSSYDSSWATLSSEPEWCMGIAFSSP